MSGLGAVPENTAWRNFVPAGFDAGAFAYDRLLGAARFRQRLRQAGFTGVHTETVPGWQHGIVHTFLATRQAPAVPGTGAAR